MGSSIGSGGFQPTDINNAPTGVPGVMGVPPTSGADPNSTTLTGGTPAWAAPAQAGMGGVAKGLNSMASYAPQRGGGGGAQMQPQPQLPAALTAGNNDYLTQALQQLNPQGQLNANLLYGG
jgi:hypothetical protein